jgi:dihydrofolate reductase
MSNVVAVEYLTLDGVMQDPGGSGEIEHGGWHNPYWNDELAQIQQEQLFASDALLLGRVTYEGFAAAWPSMKDDEGFADRMNSLPKFVASRTLEEPLDWSNSSLLKGDVAEEVAKLKAADGGDILIYGSGALVNSLLPHNLVDRYRLMVFPVVLGSGKRLFKDEAGKTDLRLTDAKTTSAGVAVLTYEKA